VTGCDATVKNGGFGAHWSYHRALPCEIRNSKQIRNVTRQQAQKPAGHAILNVFEFGFEFVSDSDRISSFGAPEFVVMSRAPRIDDKWIAAVMMEWRTMLTGSAAFGSWNHELNAIDQFPSGGL